MKARVKADYRFRTGVAFAGVEYVKNEWRDVPVNGLTEAERRMNDQAETLLEFQTDADEARAILIKNKPEPDPDELKGQLTDAAAIEAAALGVDISKIKGSGKGGVVTIGDVKGAAKKGDK